ncbi:MAG: periplasmic heavy metal sensor [Bacteroidota bacterium]|nr:periplasmic heavy metal sensor [Bacteroidota bacterium]
MKHKNVLIAILILIAIGFTAVYAQMEKDIKIIKKQGSKVEIIENDDIDFDLPPMMHKMKKLNLTDEQKKQFDKLRFEIQKKQTDAQAKVKTAGIELKELFSADKLDRTAIEKKMREIADLRVRLRLNHLDHWFAVNKILDDKQQIFWKEKLEMRGGPGMKGMMKEFGGRGKKMMQFRMGDCDKPCCDKE